MARVVQFVDSWEGAIALAGGRIIELAIGWFANFDALDMTALTLFSRIPYLFLLSTFYTSSLDTVLGALVIDVLACLLPFCVLRPLAPFRRTADAVVSDLPTLAYTIGLATAINSLVLVWAFRFFLPRLLILHFAGIYTLEPAYGASYAAILPIAAVLAVAARVFVFTPSAAAAASAHPPAPFDPVTASLAETFRHTVCDYTPSTKVFMWRTAIAAIATAINTFLFCSLTIEGVQSNGAAGYAAVWTGAVVLVGCALGIIAGE